MRPTTTTLSFGVLLKQLRKQAGMTQRDLAAALNYSDSLISSLEKEQRLPDLTFVVKRLIPALGLQDDPQTAAWLVECAAMARGEQPPASFTFQRTTQLIFHEELGEQRRALPAPPTALIGRTEEVAQLCHRLLGHQGRLLTLVGPPGIGKTTLALAVAERLPPHYRDGVVFVALAAVNEANAMAAAILAAVGGNESSPKPPKVQLIELLRRKTMLLVLDNLEQIGEAAGFIADLLRECSRLVILATSRERLHLRAEQRYKVPPLLLAAAVELFVQRAQAVDNNFCLTSHNRPTVEAICERLDRLPLAIELCAAQIELFSPPQLLAELQVHPLDLLVDGAQDLPPQQRTLRRAIQRSYQLLNQEEQTLFRILGVFVGGFDLAALAVVATERWRTGDLHLGNEATEQFLMRNLRSLIGKSLVRSEITSRGEQRFLLLETIREFAREQARVHGEEEELCQRHASYFLSLAEKVELHTGRKEQQIWHTHLNTDQDNLHTALRYYLVTDAQAALRLAAALGEFWYFRGYISEGEKWLMQALAQTREEVSHTRGKALCEMSRIASAQGNFVQATVLAEESLTIARQLADKCVLATALNFRGSIAMHQLDLATASSFLEQSLALGREVGDRQRIATALCSLGMTTTYQGDYAKARLLLDESLAIHRSLGNMVGIQLVLTNLGYNELHQGRFRQAFAYCKQGLEVGLQQDDKEGIIWCLEGLAKVRALSEEGLEDKSNAARLLGAATALRKTLGTPLPPMDQEIYEHAMTVIRTGLDDATFALAWTEGEAMPLEEVIAVAIATTVD